jgi:molybdenum cofactor cytidylyltransferase
MGCCKQLLPLGNRPVIAHCLASIFRAGIDEVIVVVGMQHEPVLRAIEAFPVTVVRNPEPESEMAASLLAGMQALPPCATAAIVSLTDHPLVSPDTYRSLLRSHREEPRKIIVPVHRGGRGHPTLFPVAVLKELEMEATLRDVVRRDPERVLLREVDDSGILADMDTPEDYRRMAEGFKKQIPPAASPQADSTSRSSQFIKESNREKVSAPPRLDVFRCSSGAKSRGR